MFRKTLFTTALCAVALCVSAQNEYDAIRRMRAANRNIAGLRSMADGEHYTVNKGRSIVRYAYADRTDTVTLAQTQFSIRDYALSPDEQSILFADSRSVRPIYRHSFTSDYWLSDSGNAPRKVLARWFPIGFRQGERPLSIRHCRRLDHSHNR